MPHALRILSFRKFFLLFALAAISAPSALPIARSQAADAPAANSPDDLKAKRTKVADEIATVTKAKDAAKAAGEKTQALDSLDAEIELLGALDLVYVQLQSTAERKDELAGMRQRLETQLDNLKKFGPPEAKPYTFMLLESIEDEIATQAQRAAAFSADKAAAQDLLAQARSNVDRCQAAERQANDQLSANRDPAKQNVLATAVHLADLASTIAAETVSLRQVEIENKTTLCELVSSYSQLLEQKKKLVEPETHFGPRDHQALADNFVRKEQEFQTQLDEVKRRLSDNESQQQVDLAKLAGDKADPAVVNAATSAYRRGRSVACEQMLLVEQRLKELKDLKDLVNCRDELAKGATATDSLRQWHDRLTQVLDGLKMSEASLVRRLDEIRIEQDSLYERKADSDDKTVALKPWLDMQSKQLDQLADTCEASLLHLRANERSLGRLESQLAAIVHAEIRANPWAAAWQWLTSWWDYSLTTVDDKSVTLGSIIKGALFLIMAMMLARLASRELGKQILPRFGLNPGAVVAIQSMSFYVFCCLFSFEALQLAGLPLATFTFLGGAAAIGIGFGSQNVLNNFISGLILLAEQPIRVGDMVEIEGIRGTIERIGARSTRMRTIANHEIMVPNSQLLQDKVTNLTLSDDLVRACIEVKIGQDISIDEVTRRLFGAAKGHPKVMASPEPAVLLTGFSSSDMTYELHFWIKLGSLIESRQVESQVRTAVCAALHGTGAEAHPAPPPPVLVAKDTSLPAPGLVAAAVALAVTQKVESTKPHPAPAPAVVAGSPALGEVPRRKAG